MSGPTSGGICYTSPFISHPTPELGALWFSFQDLFIPGCSALELAASLLYLCPVICGHSPAPPPQSCAHLGLPLGCYIQLLPTAPSQSWLHLGILSRLLYSTASRHPCSRAGHISAFLWGIILSCFPATTPSWQALLGFFSRLLYSAVPRCPQPRAGMWLIPRCSTPNLGTSQLYLCHIILDYFSPASPRAG